MQAEVFIIKLNILYHLFCSSENVAEDFDMKEHRRSVNSCLRQCLVNHSTVQDSSSPETVVATHQQTISQHLQSKEDNLWRRFVLSVNTNCGRPVLDENGRSANEMSGHSMNIYLA